MEKWYTCAPENFEAETSSSFFFRDSGLLCRELQKMGGESKVVLVGPPLPKDDPDVIRASRKQMESPEWWKSLNIHGVIMIAWARHCDTPISRAITASGVQLVLHVDGSASGYPLFHQKDTLGTLWRSERDTGRSPLFKWLSFAKRATQSAASMLIRHSYLRYRHLQQALVATYQTPTSYKRTQQLCRFFGGRNHKVNLALVGYPIPQDYFWEPQIPKEKRIVAIGRWDALRQKRPFLLMAVCAEIARRQIDLQIDIFGKKTEALQKWHAALQADLQQRIHLHGVQPASEVSKTLQRAQITFFPSANEGGPQSLFEGLACGATTVGFDSPSMPGTLWAAQNGHGELVEEDTIAGYVDALERELAKWQQQRHSPQQISEFWKPYTNVRAVLQRMLSAAEAAAACK